MADESVISPGQEELLGAMLGKDSTLPGDCKLAGGSIEKTIVKATYACPSGEVVVELEHPAAAPADATRTDKFALHIERGTPPPGLQNALLSRIRERETQFHWTVYPPPTPVAQRTVPARAGVVVVLVLLVLGVWLLWRRLGRRTSHG